MLLSAVAGLADTGDDLAAMMLENLVGSMPVECVARTAAAVRRLGAANG